MPLDFTVTDWAASRAYWPDLFGPDELNLKGKRGLRFLEVGCFEGLTTLWLLENVLTHRTSTITVVDPFDVQRGALTNLERFTANLRPYLDRVARLKGRSEEVLAQLVYDADLYADDYDLFDFVYVDGSHEAADVLWDAVLTWRLLKPGGVVVFDDYDWPELPETRTPTIAVDSFVRCYRDRVAEHGPRLSQYVVRKAAA